MSTPISQSEPTKRRGRPAKPKPAAPPKQTEQEQAEHRQRASHLRLVQGREGLRRVDRVLREFGPRKALEQLAFETRDLPRALQSAASSARLYMQGMIERDQAAIVDYEVLHDAGG